MIYGEQEQTTSVRRHRTLRHREGGKTPPEDDSVRDGSAENAREKEMSTALSPATSRKCSRWAQRSLTGQGHSWILSSERGSVQFVQTHASLRGGAVCALSRLRVSSASRSSEHEVLVEMV